MLVPARVAAMDIRFVADTRRIRLFESLTDTREFII